MTQDKKTPPTTPDAELFFKALKPEQQQAVYDLYFAVYKANVSSFVAKDIGNTFSGSDKALFNLGVVSGENNVIKQLKLIIQRGW
tara:strand:- start:413 stop:667 length:255 start_codon:yes stop_codon:yes gene_type:complete